MKVISVFTLLLFTVFILIPVSSCKEKRGELKRIWYNGSYNRDFNDLNALHIEAATTLGIDPVSSREEAKHASKKMKEIKTNKYYEVENLTHSIPFLVPEAEKLLTDIGRNFQDTLKNLNAPIYTIKVTSVTRTIDDIQGLRKRNINSSENSAHLYGTTFDISWNKFTKMDEKDTLNIGKDELKMVLAMVLRDLKREKRCYIKHERKQGCFHITVRP
ncbi:DUF5715 family protein [Parabacteroides sp. PF5-9]|uniref:DUF5715 family protein n=1 Tax=Parabacteroides sp. PF5-9 TaxID=1742404 RepID=UPI00247621FA|nr:DUF5715 family protein [Parabacteroides sp. PF5-9]MDH6357258.1 uncharacterized protein YcbK (DUF882 family) [Parabacteroides sp. PF5-9]